MRWIVGGMMFALWFVGPALILLAISEAYRKFAASGRLIRTEGSVVSIARKMFTSNSGGRTRSTWHYFPVIRYCNQAGEEVTFTSSIGESGPKTRYHAGQRLRIVYDPEGELDPIIDSFSGMWLSVIMMLIAGAVFIGGGVLIYVAFGDRIFGP